MMTIMIAKMMVIMYTVKGETTAHGEVGDEGE
jgi:hypothetical protein